MEEKFICSKCGSEKISTEFQFYTRKDRKGNPRYRDKRCKTCISQYGKEHNKTPKAKQINRDWILKNQEKHLCYHVKACCKRLKRKFSLLPEDILIPERCPILGLILESRGIGKRKPQTMSLDRINSNRGYVRGNIQVISWRANMLKSNATLDELILMGEWAQKQKFVL